MQTKTVLVVGVLLIFISALFFSPGVDAADDIEDIDVMVLITTAFGWNYFDIVEILEGWNVNVTTVSATLTLEVPSCYNKPPRPVTADILLSDMDNESIDEFDALVIPSGGHWDGLVSRSSNLDFIANAHARGLVIATMCIGNRVVCRSNNIVNHTKVAAYTMTNVEMRNEGATIVYNTRVVSDNRIITGGAGAGYQTGGHEGAPTFEVCSELVRTVLGIRHVVSANLNPTTWNDTAIYEISVTTQDPSTLIEELNSTGIQSVTAIFYPKDGNEEWIKTAELTDSDADGVYTGTTGDLRMGSYDMIIELESTNETTEVIDPSLEIIYEEPDPTIPLGDLTVFAVGAVAIIAVVFVSVIIFKRKG